MKRIKKIKLTSFQIILFGFLGVIFLGGIILMLPICNKEGVWTSFIDAIFTSTSAVCVTGLIVHDTATYWNMFGQIIILILIQIGGMGIVTVAVSFALLSGKKIGLFGRNTIKEAISAPSVGGIVNLAGFIIKGIFLFELLGALVMMPIFVKDYGIEGIWMAIFHSVSAFCNAGFDIMGSKGGEFSSLSIYSANPIISLTIICLIIIGGIGFLVWRDVFKYKLSFKKYSPQSKIVIIMTLVLIILPTIYNFFVEFYDYALGERILVSLFQAVTPRTAGFNTVGLNSITEVGLFIMIILMLIGGSPGSTAGGMKTTTVAVLLSSTLSVFRNKKTAHLAKRRISDENIKNAVAIFMIYLLLFIFSGTIISLIEGIPLRISFFETASAIGTVGLSLGVTPLLGVVSKIILMVLMFFGRVGALTLVYAAVGNKSHNDYDYPLTQISVG